MPTKIPDSPTIRIAPDVKLGENVKIYAFVNLYGCSVGDDTRIGTFVEIQKGASVGRSCKISSHTFICEGVHIEDECFIGHGVMFINDLYPHATAENGVPQTEQDWKVVPTYVRRRASIGSNATILGGVTIGEGAIVGAGAVVTRDVPAGTIVAGSPARVLRKVDQPRESTERVGRYDVPFLDLKAQYVQIKDEVHAAMNNVMETSAFVLGEAVKNFEGAFAAHHGAQYCVATSCGTSALHVALLAMGIGSGDEVIVPVNTFIATAGAVSHCGAKPVFVDMDEKDYCIDPQKIARAVTPRTKVVIPVHLYGQPAEMDQIMAIAEQYGLKILEDCAQAHDAEYRGRKVGTFGVAGAFSFYPGKNLGAYGEGGAVLTNDEALAAKMRMLRDHGSAKKYYHDMVGYNYRMHGFQGAVLGVKLKYLVAWTDARRRIAKRYEQLLSAHGALVKQTKPYVRHVYHLFVVRVKNRDKVAAILKDQGVATGIHYPIPLHLTRAYADLGYKKGDFPVTEAAADELLSLPMYPELTDEMINYVAVSLKQAL